MSVEWLRDVAGTFEFFSDSYIATLAIGLVVAYLGVFVVLRRIVFLGITLAQAASAGIALAFFAQGFLGHETRIAEAIEEHGPMAGAIGVSTIGVAAFSLRAESKRISREALLGLGYILFGAGAVLLVWRSPKGIDELKDILAGDVLFARSHLQPLLIGLALVAVVHMALRKEFLLVSYDAEFARTLGVPVRRYEVLLALTLALAISLALKVAGILLVFAFLSVPPIAGLAIGRTLGEATWIALGVAAASSGLGFIVATRADLPVAPTVAAILVAFAALAAAASKSGRNARTGYVFIVALLALSSLAAAGDSLLGHEGLKVSAPSAPIAPLASGSTPSAAMLQQRFRTAADPAVRLEAATLLARTADDETLAEFVRTALGDEDEQVRESAIVALAKISNRARAVGAVAPLLRADDANLRLHAALGLARLGDARAVEALIGLLKDAHASPGVRGEAHDALLKLNAKGDAFGYDPFADDAANHKAVLLWEAWWKEQRSRLGGAKDAPR